MLFHSLPLALSLSLSPSLSLSLSLVVQSHSTPRNGPVPLIIWWHPYMPLLSILSPHCHVRAQKVAPSLFSSSKTWRRLHCFAPKAGAVSPFFIRCSYCAVTHKSTRGVSFWSCPMYIYMRHGRESQSTYTTLLLYRPLLKESHHDQPCHHSGKS